MRYHPRLAYYGIERRGGACEQGRNEYVIGTHGPESIPPARAVQGFAKVDWVMVLAPLRLQIGSGRGVIG